MCACAPCQIRRRTSKIVLIHYFGKEAKSFIWDGINTQLNWIPPTASKIRHWKMLDEHGEEVVSGNVFIDLKPNYDTRLDIKLFMDSFDKVRLSVEQSSLYLENRIEVSDGKLDTLGALTGICRKQVSPPAYVLDSGYMTEGGLTRSLASLHRVDSVVLYHSTQGTLTFRIYQTPDSSLVDREILTIQANEVLKNQMAAGIGWALEIA